MAAFLCIHGRYIHIYDQENIKIIYSTKRIMIFPIHLYQNVVWLCECACDGRQLALLIRASQMGSYSRLTIVDHYSGNGLTWEDPEDKNGSMLSSALAYISSLRRRLLPDMLSVRWSHFALILLRVGECFFINNSLNFHKI